jgi:hypothetical protein
MEDHVTVWRVTTRFRDFGGAIEEAPLYFRSLDAARDHFESLKGSPEGYVHSKLEELRVAPPVQEGLCATLSREIEDEYILQAKTLDVWTRASGSSPP